MSENNLNLESSDTELIDSFKRGNQNAFNLIVRKYQKKVYWIVRKMVLDHDDADDITQEVFLKLYRSVSDFRGESKFFTYIYKIAINFSLNHISRTKKLSLRKADICYSDIRSYDKPADEMMNSRERTEILEEAIRSLPEQQRAVFNMRYYDDLPYEEISKILDMSVGTLKTNYHYAKDKVEQYIKDNYSEEF